MDDSNDPTPTTDTADRTGAGLPESTLDDDELFEALAHGRRRYLLYTLAETEQVSLRTLARRLATWESSSADGTVEEDDVARVFASLYHAHVQKLADLGIVSFDPREETVTAGPNADVVFDVLERTGRSAAERMAAHARGDDRD